MPRIASGGDRMETLAPRIHPVFPHQPRNAFAGTSPALFLQFGVNPRTPIDATIGDKHLLNMSGETSIFSFVLAFRALAPGVIPALGNRKHPAHDHNRKLS